MVLIIEILLYLYVQVLYSCNYGYESYLGWEGL